MACEEVGVSAEAVDAVERAVSHYYPTDEAYTISVIEHLRAELSEPSKLTLAEYLQRQAWLRRALRRLDRLQRSEP